MDTDDLIKTANIQKIAEDGAKIYERMKAQYEPKERGKFLAIDVESGEPYLGATSAEALALARARHPHKIFYVAKIGFDVAETVARSYIGERN